MRLTAVLTVALFVMFGGTSTAKAHLVTKPKNNTLHEIKRSQTANLAHARFVCHQGGGSHKRWACKAVKWISRELAETINKLSPFYGRPPHYEQWMCIHGYEGAWNDTDAPHWGGLQMDMSFQRTYGPELLKAKGTADNWTPLEQMWIAERAYSGYAGHKARGFYPWPNTARYCGLI